MIRPPTKKTLDRYGITAAEWLERLKSQGWMCPICEMTPHRPVVDHEHAPGWARMPPEERKRYVRGILCWRDNKFAVGQLKLEQAERVVRYLREYKERSKNG